MIIGREEELGALVSFLSGAPPRALVLEGEAGIGKTVLWRHALEAAREEGIATLVAAPGENESSLPYAALTDLLEGLAPKLTGSSTVGADDTDEHEVSRAALALVRSAAAQPLLIAVDDVQWLDPPSARALEFILRRLGDLPIRVLVARRSAGVEPPPLGLARTLSPMRIDAVRLSPLDAIELDELLRSRLGLQLPRPALTRLERITEGNPYYALEIAQSLADNREVDVPRSLAEALESRIASLPRPAQDALVLAAACLQPSPDLVERAAGGQAGLKTALEERLLEVSGRRLRFTHPLLGSVAYHRALPGDRRDAHRRLAGAADAGSPERAVHLARSQDAPDEAIAAELEEAGGLAAGRGGPGLAAELAEAAARLTPEQDPAARRRRLGSAANYHEAEGDPARARELLEQLIASLSAGPERAGLLRRYADMLEDAPMEELIRLCEQALAEATGEPSLSAEIHSTLAAFSFIAGDLGRSLEHARSSVRFAEEAGDDARLAVAIGEACNTEALLAVPWDREAMARALEIERRVEEIPPWDRPSYQLALISIVTDDLEAARPLVTAELERARGLGNEPGIFHLLLRVVDLELRSGRWAEALRAAREAHAHARQGGLDLEEATTGAALASVLAHLGDLEESRVLAEAAHRVAEARGHRGLAIRAAGVLGMIELQARDVERAVEWLLPAGEELREMGMGELSISGVAQNEIEALVACDRLEEAEKASAYVRRAGEPAGRTWHRAVAARGVALVASARGDGETARKAIGDALEANESLPQPFERARTLLAAGLVERRARRWGPARDALTLALELFDQLGAARFSERTATELARLPGRRPGSGELTETEQRVAELVAKGLSNKEVAAAMFVTVRTVEANLTKVYAKLGIRGRTELARKLAG